MGYFSNAQLSRTAEDERLDKIDYGHGAGCTVRSTTAPTGPEDPIPAPVGRAARLHDVDCPDCARGPVCYQIGTRQLHCLACDWLRTLDRQQAEDLLGALQGYNDLLIPLFIASLGR